MAESAVAVGLVVVLLALGLYLIVRGAERKPPAPPPVRTVPPPVGLHLRIRGAEPLPSATAAAQRAAGSMATPGWRGWHSAVAGESYRNDDGSDRQAVLRQATAGEAVTLACEPDNPHDRKAVKVSLTGSGAQIGYLPRGHRLESQVRRGEIRARLAEVTGGTPDRPHRGAVLWLEVPAELDRSGG